MDYHITIGTYGTRLHGGSELTVDRVHSRYGEEFVGVDPQRERFERDEMIQNPVYLTDEQRQFIEETIPDICERGKWIYHIAACQSNHIHLLVSTQRAADCVGAKEIRRWLKQWLTSALNEKYGKQKWFAKCGSTKYLYEKGYFETAYEYIKKQRTT
jgi:REP element-mobilizing transposase RayT